LLLRLSSGDNWPAHRVGNRIELVGVLRVSIGIHYGAALSHTLLFHLVVFHELVCADMLDAFLLHDILAYFLKRLV